MARGYTSDSLARLSTEEQIIPIGDASESPTPMALWTAACQLRDPRTPAGDRPASRRRQLCGHAVCTIRTVISLSSFLFFVD
ncbi:hypothetical protein AAFF_G00154460 [Aldrovandia affinis]|uniref:Uncharacterized protein n=1 Tax=Aldrovandia affinis TaxID=143900 RepID=A0AAD7WWR5_9TELE|nr:hypothetical protein AAFF_G00154460 [Aldrovandia affinis]